MKTTLFLICITFLFSCSKEPNEPNNNPPLSGSGSVQYKVNGQLIVMDNVDLVSGQYAIFSKQLQGTVLPATRYLLNAQKGANNVFAMTIVTDSLRLMNYHYDSTADKASSAFIVNFNGQNAGLYFKEDLFDVNITSYINSRITGTFSAKFTPILNAGFGQPGSVVISEGVLNNVQVIY